MRGAFVNYLSHGFDVWTSPYVECGGAKRPLNQSALLRDLCIYRVDCQDNTIKAGLHPWRAPDNFVCPQGSGGGMELDSGFPAS
jgi:hypothetical protein